MLAFPLMAEVHNYHGVDISSIAIQQLKNFQDKPEHKERVAGLDRATFEVRSANDVRGLAHNHYDVIMLPSVVQYFPSSAYLRDVITRLVPLVRSGGCIYVGDVRHLGLLEAFHASVQIYKASDPTRPGELLQQLDRQLRQEQELVLAPGFFLEFAKTLSQITHVEILPKPGRHWNEMTCFRYDVILHVGTCAEESPAPWINWTEHPLTLDEIETQLRTQPHLALRQVTNLRVSEALCGLAWIRRENLDETVADFRRRHAGVQGIDPEDLEIVARKTGHRVIMSLASDHPDGAFDVIFGRDLPEHVAIPATPLAGVIQREYSNNPLGEKHRHAHIAHWRDFLGERLPSYMVPSQFVVLDAMPLTPNGKIDRKRLPAPDNVPMPAQDSHLPPVTPTETMLAGIWQEVLRLERVGRHDHFFALGGHSLLATQVVSRLRRQLGIELPLRTVFAAPTLAGLAEQIDQRLLLQRVQQVPDDLPSDEREEILI